MRLNLPLRYVIPHGKYRASSCLWTPPPRHQVIPTLEYSCGVLDLNLLDNEAEGLFDDQNVVFEAITVDDLVGQGGSASPPYIPLLPQSQVYAPFESSQFSSLATQMTSCSSLYRSLQPASLILSAS